MNQQQIEFALRAMNQLTRVLNTCNHSSTTTAETLGRKQLGDHTIVVRIIAEIEEGFAAPLASHASRLGAEPRYPIKTRHHNKHRSNRWHKPPF